MLEILVLIMLFVLLRVFLLKNLKHKTANNSKEGRANLTMGIHQDDLTIEADSLKIASDSLDDDRS
jgi:hypothetical protein